MKSNLTRPELVQKFLKIRKLTVEICENLSDEDNNLQCSTDQSPNKWHLAHSTWFFETFVLERFLTSYKYYNENWLYYLNSYYKSKGRQIPKDLRHIISRPGFGEILNYRKIIENRVLELVSKNDSEEMIFLIDLGLNHEQQHQELMLQDIKYNLFNGIEGSFYRKKNFNIVHKYSNNWLDFDEGVYDFGYEGDNFFYDNEKGRHKQYLHSFRLRTSLVTNGEFLEFVNNNCYNDPIYWHSMGWNWIKANKIEKPLYWIEVDGKLYEYTLNGIEKLELNKPVSHISYYEAAAFARFRNKRLPTEFELELAAIKYPTKVKNLLSELKVSLLDAQGFSEANFLGNLWEWTSSNYLPYAFYKQDKGALGEYNGKFMSGQMVLRGGSCLTPEGHLRETYRNFYPPEKRWVQCGFRLAEYIK